jgi:metal transporter CNNM
LNLTNCGLREIIDESDVFVDVHKAIRRMAPAPKSRVPKGKIVEEPPMSVSLTDGELKDEEEPRSTSVSRRSEPPRRRSSVEAPPPRFQLRKQNHDNSSNSTDQWFTQRGATDEIREHLKHLGPSNLASRPRQTRYNTVKIKRSGNSPSRSAQTDFESGQSRSDSPRFFTTPAYQGGIGAGLVNSGADAKDGAHALKLGYGTISSFEHSPRDLTVHENVSYDNYSHDYNHHDHNSQEDVTNSTGPQQWRDFPQVSIPEAVHEEHEDRPVSGSARKSSSGHDSVRSTESHTEFIYHHRGPARSGSITEQIVDVNGIRKVVLHTTNCTSSSDGEHSAHLIRDSSPGHKIEATDLNGLDSEHPDTPSNSKSKKRRRRKKHGQHPKPTDGEPSEDQPLLQ